MRRMLPKLIIRHRGILVIAGGLSSLLTTFGGPTPAIAMESPRQSVGKIFEASPSNNHAASPLPWRLQTDLGLSLFLQSRSLALGHLSKPHIAFSFSRPLWDRWQWGARALATLDGSGHYQVAGVMAQVQRSLWQGPLYHLSAVAGLGAGHNADILYDDLKADLPAVPYAALGLQNMWKVGPAYLGVRVDWLNLSVVQSALSMAVDL